MPYHDANRLTRFGLLLTGVVNLLAVLGARAADPVIVNRFAVGPKQVEHIALSPDGKYLAAGCDNGTVKLWDVAAGTELKTLSIGKSVRTVVFSPDSKLLAVGRHAAGTTVRELPSGKERCDIAAKGGFTDMVVPIGFMPDGKGLAVYASRFQIRDLDTAEVTSEWDEVIGFDTKTGALSPTGKWAAFGRGVQFGEKPDTRVFVVDLPSGKRREKRLAQTEGCEVMTASPDGVTLATVKGWASEPSTTVNVWDVPTDSLKFELKGHDRAVNALVFSPDGKYLATGSTDRTARVWDAKTGSEVARVKLDDLITTVAIGPGGKTLAAGGTAFATVTVWDLTPALRSGGR